MRLRGVVLVALAAVLLVLVVPTQSSEGDRGELIGLGYVWESPSGFYTLNLQYYDGDFLSLQASYSGPEQSSEMGRSVYIRLFDEEFNFISESSLVRLDRQFSYSDIAGYTLEDGIYVVRIVNPSYEMIVQAWLAVDVSVIDMIEPHGGTVTPGPAEYTVPTGTVLDVVGEDLVATFRGYPVLTFTAEPPYGMVYRGWYADGLPFMQWTVDCDVEVEVRWSVDEVTVYFDPGLGSGEMDPVTMDFGSFFFVPQCTFEPPEGEIFHAWVSGGTSYQPGERIAVRHDMMFTAVWTETPQPVYFRYTLSFDMNGGEGGPADMEYVTVDVSHTFEIPYDEPEMEGFAFVGWSTSPYGVPEYYPGSEFGLEVPVLSAVLYAVWVRMPVKDIILDVHGVILNPEGSYVMGVTTVPPGMESELIWSSSDTGVVTVEGGRLQAHSVGDAVVTVSTPDGSVTKNVYVHVTWDDPPIKDFTLDTYKLDIDSGSSVSIGVKTVPAGMEHYLVWDTSDPSVIVADDGVITALSPGDAVITVSTPDGYVTRTVEVHSDPVVKEIRILIDRLEIAVGSSIDLPVSTVPEGLEYLLEWHSSDPSVKIEDGRVTGVSEGDAVITVSYRDISVDIPVRSVRDPVPYAEEEIRTDGGGSVILELEPDEEGVMRLVNPITLVIGSTDSVTQDQYDLADTVIASLAERMIDPDVIIRTDGTTVLTMRELIGLITGNGGSLTVVEGDVTLLFSTAVLEGLGDVDDMSFNVVPQEIEGDEIIIDDIKIPNAKAYDIFILMNGQRIHTVFSEDVQVTVDYRPGERLDPARIMVYHLDILPPQPVLFIYGDDGVRFGVSHFSIYAIGYTDLPPSEGDITLYVVSAAAIPLVLLLFLVLLWRHTVYLDLGKGTVRGVPEGWRIGDDGRLYRRFRVYERFSLPDMHVETPDGSRLVSWMPKVPGRVWRKVTLYAVYSDEE